RGADAAGRLAGDAHRHVGGAGPGVDHVHVVAREAGAADAVEPAEVEGGLGGRGRSGQRLVGGVGGLHALGGQDRLVGGHLVRAHEVGRAGEDLLAPGRDGAGLGAAAGDADGDVGGAGARVDDVDVVAHEAGAADAVEPAEVEGGLGGRGGLCQDLVEGLVELHALGGEDRLVGVDGDRSAEAGGAGEDPLGVGGNGGEGGASGLSGDVDHHGGGAGPG